MSNLLEELNPSQQEAVTHESGPLLIIAGPGSGKTRTVVHSIAYAIENGVQPDRILAFSFTRKACKELTERITRFVGKEEGQLVNIFTFHSFCRRVLKKDIEELHRGYTRNFKALEPEDQKREVGKQIAKIRAQINHLQHREFLKTKDILDFITRCKLQFIPPSVADEHMPHSEMPPEISRAYVEIYESYEQVLEANDWIDYANQLRLANELLRDVHEVKKKWQEKFELIFVDEYQDTDRVQYQIIETLAEQHQNLRVVGDDDQGIYSFREADIQNILKFEKNYSTAKIIPLGQNYRSTQRIVNASRALAEFNPDRRKKELFTENSVGKNIIHLHCRSAEEEVGTIISFIISAIRCGWSSKDFAILCRLNSQVDEFKTAFNSLENPQDLDDVSVMTIHRAKGLEFPNVFVAGVCKGLLPFGGNIENEERRLLYVAMTRAENWLCLSSYGNDAGSNANGRSPFLDEIPRSLLEPTQTLGVSDIPSKPIRPNRAESLTVFEEPLDSTTLSPIKPEIVLGIDPGKIDANNPNVGWAVTEKSSDGYTVIDCDTETPEGTSDEKLKQIENQINALIASYSPDAIAVEKLEGATDRGLIGVAGCVALVRSIADRHGIERAFYSPQQVKYAATGNRNAEKEEVQEGVKRRCDFSIAQNNNNIDDHSADAIAVSLCYLDSYLNSSHLQWKKRKQEHYDSGIDYLSNGQYDAAVAEFKEAISTDPIYTEAYYGLGQAYLAQSNLEAAENAAKKSLKLAENNHPDSQKLLEALRHYRFGCKSLNNREWNEAIDKFKESITLEPIFTEAHCELSRAYFEIGNLETAKNAAEEALRLRYEYPPAQKLLVDIKKRYYYNGEISFNREEYAQALFEFQKAVEIDQNFKGAYRFIGEAYLKLGDLEKAEKGAKDALNIDRNYELAQELIEKIKRKHKEHGDNYRDRKAYIEALISYQHAIRIDNKYKEVYNNLGMVYRAMKEYSKAISAYQQAINIDGRCQATHNNLSIVYRKIGEYDKAIRSLERAIEIKPNYQIAYYNLARTYFEMEKLPDASEKVFEALRLDPNEQDTLKLQKNIMDTYLKQGSDYFRRSNLAAAENSAKKALTLDSNYQPAHKLLNDIKQTYYEQGLVCIENSAHAEAISALQKTVKIDPEFKEAHYSLGEIYFAIGDLEAAEKEVGKVLRIDAQDELASCLLISIKEKYYNRGLTSLKQNEWKAASKFAEKALRIDRNYKFASILLKNAYCQQALDNEESERYHRSINLLQKAENIHPNCEKTHYYLGRVYFKIGRLKEARTHVNKALSIQPNYPSSQKLLKEIKDARNWLKLSGKQVRRLLGRIAKRIGF